MLLRIVNQRDNQYLDKLVELETAIIQRKANAEFNVPIIEIYGLEKQGEGALLVSDNLIIAQDASNEIEIETGDDSVIEGSDIVDIMEELDDSTDSQQWG